MIDALTTARARAAVAQDIAQCYSRITGVQQAMLDTIPDAVWRTDAGGCVVACNAAFARLARAAVRDVLGRPLTAVLGAPYREGVELRLLDMALRPRAVQHRLELAEDGQERTIEERLTPSFDEAGAFDGIVWAWRDVSAITQAQAQLERERTAAQDALRVRTDFLANVSHEIRTPLNSVIGLTHLVLRTALDDRQRSYLGQVEASAQHLLALVNDLLDFSKIEAGQLTVEQQVFSLRECLGAVDAVLRQKCNDKGLALTVSCAEGVPSHVVGDSLRLTQVLLNLGSNAAKFTGQGQVRIHVTHAGGSRGLQTLRFEVTDTGPGIPADVQARLFEDYYQADTSIARKFGGTGLGLALSRRIVTLLGGEIGVRSQPGEGSSFWFTANLGACQGLHRGGGPGRAPSVPATAAPPAPRAATAAPVPAEPGPFAGGRVLLVEDNTMNQLVGSALLEAHGIAVELAGDGLAGVRQALAQPWDLVLMDIQMPVMDGLEAMRRIRAAEAVSGRRAVIVALTANTSPADRAAALAAGADDFLAKPIEPDLLEALLTRWMGAAAQASR